MTRLQRLTAALLLLGMLLLPGCWDARELNHLALVMAAGVDRNPETGRFEVTVQIARPGPSGQGQAGGGVGGAGGGAQEPVYTATGDGDTIFAAIRNLAQFTSRRIMWAHNNVVAIGEDLAREDITPVIDFFTRNPELRLRTWMVVVRGGTARELVSAKTGMEAIPADSISALFRYADLPGEAPRTDVNEVAAAFFASDLHPIISAMRLTPRTLPPTESPGEHGGRHQVELRGTAVIHRTRLVGFVQEGAGRGLLWLRGQIGNAAISIPCPDPAAGKMAVEIRDPQVSIEARLRNRMPAFRVEVSTDGWLTEQNCPTGQMEVLELKAYVERATARKITSDIREALRVLQEELRTDAIQFGRTMHLQHPAWWHANRNRWDDLFPEVDTEVTVSATIPKLGLYTLPMDTSSPRP